jgi:hypothetical protein
MKFNELLCEILHFKNHNHIPIKDFWMARIEPYENKSLELLFSLISKKNHNCIFLEPLLGLMLIWTLLPFNMDNLNKIMARSLFLHCIQSIKRMNYSNACCKHGRCNRLLNIYYEQIWICYKFCNNFEHLVHNHAYFKAKWPLKAIITYMNRKFPLQDNLFKEQVHGQIERLCV